MNILFTLSYYNPYVSGLTIHVQRLAEELAKKKDYSISIFTSQHDKKLRRNEIINNVSVQRVPYLFRFHKGFLMPSYLSEAMKSIKNNDVIVINAPQLESLFIAIVARLFNKKLFCIYHCEIRLPDSVLNRCIEFASHVIHVGTLLLCDKIVTYTQDFAKHSILLPYFRKKVVYNYPPIPKPTIHKDLVSDFQKKYRLKNKYVLGVSARIAAEKGIEYLLQTIPFMQNNFKKDFIILFAGPKNPVGEENYLRKINPLFEKYRKYISFVGTLSFDEIGAFYTVLDILVLPSINSTEAFGMVQVEAMLCGVPVVATNLPGVRVPIQLTKMGQIVKIKDPKNLAEKIVEVVKNKKRYQKPSSIVSEIFSLNSTIEKYEEILT